MNSNQGQTEAICHGDGPMLVLAGPGSGKTFVITSRVRHLIEHLSVHPEHISVITFSKSAALEMKERFDLLTNHSYPAVTFGTFHACFFRILQQAYNYSTSNILKESESMRLLTDILSRIAPELSEDRDLVVGVLNEILSFKGNYALSSEAERAAFRPVSCDREHFFAAYRQYETTLRRENRIDFEDMLLLTYELLSERGDILAYWQQRYHYLLIDEFQDINRLQYRIVQLLTGASRNLFIVGDDDQSIYGFRGSNPEIMLSFPKDYPDCKQVLLSVNYRCRPEIVAAAGNLISASADRFPKQLTSAKAPGLPVEYPVFETVAEENAFLADRVVTLLSEGIPASEIAILFRTNLQMRSLAELLGRRGIPFRIRGVPPCIYDNPYVTVLLAYLRVALGSRNRRDLLAIANKPVRYIERSMLHEEETDLDELIAYCDTHGKEYVAERLRRLLYDLDAICRMNPYAAIHYICHVVGFHSYLADNIHNPEEALETVREFMDSAKEYARLEDFLSYVQDYREHYQEHFRTQDDSREDSILLTTFHSCKGLEFEYVFLADCNELLTPHKKALLPEHIAEERRLFYVAMTRAKEQLMLCWVRKRFGREMEPSRFLGESRLSVNAFRPGVHIRHKQLGNGTVRHIDGDHMTVRFDRHLLPKTLSLRYCIEAQLISVVSED